MGKAWHDFRAAVCTFICGWTVSALVFVRPACIHVMFIFLCAVVWSQSGVCCAEMCSVLHAICSGVSESQVCALLNLREKLLSSQGHRPDGALTAVSRELACLSKVLRWQPDNDSAMQTALDRIPPVTVDVPFTFYSYAWEQVREHSMHVILCICM